ncbi:MAG: 8-oxoguanine DNA glycosylase [Candidatus Bathyarchaeota archaeon]|nr:8-oxoguanine DNA glycosylase [Candidatus Bathyarchaeota archaeon]
MLLKLDAAFNLDSSLCCGQVFRWSKLDGWWYGVVGEKVIKIRQCGGTLEFFGVDEGFVRWYFRLDDDLAEIGGVIDNDPNIHSALQRYVGLRLVRQEPWNCLIGFICSIQKNIPAIEHMLQQISQRYGEKRMFDGKTFYLFPTAEKLAHASESSLRECSLGFRAKYVHATAKKIHDGNLDLNSLRKLPYLEARRKLLEFQGVGLKVADCVTLFSLDKTEAFPVDVWVKRVILKYYSDKLASDFVKRLQSRQTLTNGEYQKIGDWARGYFGCYAGYAQEYLYHYERSHS